MLAALIRPWIPLLPWLACSPDEALDWDEWVLNTEAHPLRIAGWEKRAAEKKARVAAEQQQQHKAGRKFGFSSLWQRKR